MYLHNNNAYTIFIIFPRNYKFVCMYAVSVSLCVYEVSEVSVCVFMK